MDWQPYRACCLRHAKEADIAFCPECGHPFIRCMAFAECGSLVTPLQECPICVAPALAIDAGAMLQLKTGERVSVPLILRNETTGNRPLFVKQIFKMDGRVDEPVALTWERIDPQTERHFTVDLPPLAEVRELGPQSDPQSDFVDELAALVDEREPPETLTELDTAESNANVVPIHQPEA